MRDRKTMSHSATASRDEAPARTLEARENQMIDKAMDLVEQRLLDGSASPSETVHFLRLGTSRARLEKEKLEKENALLQAKRDALDSSKEIEELYVKAIAAMSHYQGNNDENI